ncbi:MAG TPA: preprotein translocase subunit SecG [Candidatus Azoamicus sp.]
MLNFLLIFHIIISCLLIIFILLNKWKGSEIGATFNSNVDFMSSKESNSLIKKIIITLTIILLISITLINITNNKQKTNQEKAIVKIIEK